MKSNPLPRILPALACLALFMAAAKDCNNSSVAPTDPAVRDGVQSSIVPLSPVIPGTDTIHLESPEFARTISVSQANLFAFGTSGYSQGILVVLKAPPDVTLGRISNLASDCVAGAASMAGQVFDGKLSLGPNASTSDFYACTSNPTTPLSQTIKVGTCSAASSNCSSPLHTGVDYWWVVLGYDAAMKLTHSSPAYRFRLKD